ncbi:Quinone oxidoreductase PIG3 [uncultured Alphaproteobacteria bacterium]|uniref:Quinone oxidoreductase PIG3 n=1 Tax=uncultured Alphaproteobacteria bacterium TaxID=91750 RepID=A0A212JEK2_9PROT|nr:Quinone oxidoreductase PIG3 [uncultured Alphaproteobacteria bacterium]
MPALPETVTCIEIKAFGGPEGLVPTTRPMPEPGAGEVLIQVAAAGVNRPDVVQRQGNYAPPPGATDIPGLEVAGEIVKLGPGVDEACLGQRVCALLTGGGYADYAVAKAALCLPFPKDFDALHAAAIPETFFTVWHNVFERGALKAGETFLIHGGTGGIGSTAIQLAKAMGARVFATAGSAEKAAACEKLGAERGINYREEDYVEVVKDLTGGKGVNVILDVVGGDYLNRDVKAMAPSGRHVSIAFQKGAKVEFNFMPLMLKRLTFTGSVLRSQPTEEKARIAAGLKAQVWPLLDDGTLKPLVYKTFPLAEAAAAHQLMESSQHIGKIMLVP